jgi:hypothetical protein
MAVVKRSVNVECPRGHRIGTVTLYNDGPDVRIGQHVKGLRGSWADVWRHAPDTGETVQNVEIRCAGRDCGYKGSFVYSRLAAELDASPVPGEYRLAR